jgi:hypothetical protein
MQLGTNDERMSAVGIQFQQARVSMQPSSKQPNALEGHVNLDLSIPGNIHFAYEPSCSINTRDERPQ